jgi:hypothetical protein
MFHVWMPMKARTAVKNKLSPRLFTLQSDEDSTGSETNRERWDSHFSGASTSRLGYLLWYSLLPHIAPTNGATVQLSVPVIAAFGGLVLVGEAVSLRLVTASLLVLGSNNLTIRTPSTTS